MSGTRDRKSGDGGLRGYAMRSLPARFPPNGAWPIEMRADMAAAFLDYETTGKLLAAILRKEAPRPTVTRLRDGKRVPLWARDAMTSYVAKRHDAGTGAGASSDYENVANLI